MQTYGFHTVHGRAPTVATGVKVARPELSVWMITGDGDGLSIGGNHLLHVLRRNPDINILLFNNRVYGLTKGQYSPTSNVGMKTKSTPMHLLTILSTRSSSLLGRKLALLLVLLTPIQSTWLRPSRLHAHKGVSFVEIFQNCVIYNKDVWEGIYGREARAEQILYLEEGKPLVFGKEKDKGVRLNGLAPELVTIGEGGASEDELLKHDPRNDNPLYATLLSQLVHPQFPTPVGVFRSLIDPPMKTL